MVYPTVHSHDEITSGTFVLVSKIMRATQPLWLIIIPASFLIVFLYKFYRTIISYFEEMTDAISSVITQPEKQVTLNKDLKIFENEINQIREDLVENKKKVEKNDEEKQKLLLYLAHDLKTPLTSIKGYMAFLQNPQVYDNLDFETRNRYFKIVSDKSDKLDELLNDFFEISKVGINKGEIEKEKVNLSLMLKQISFEFSPLLKKQKLKWQLKIEDNLFAMVNVMKFERVLNNIIKNAISYAPESTDLELFLHKKDGQAVISLRNHSNNLSKEAEKRLFDPFFRGDQARNTATGNSGLGLAIAKQIIEDHGGTIKAKVVDHVFEVSIYI